MAVPKTNLFKGDRVRLSKSYLIQKDLTTKGGNGAGGFIKARRERVGTIVTDTLNKRNNYLQVHWDGNAKAHEHDLYMPDDLVLFEDEEYMNASLVKTEVPRRRRERTIAEKGQPSWYGNNSTLRQQRPGSVVPPGHTCTASWRFPED